MDIFFVSLISILLIFLALHFGKKVRVRDNERLLNEIECDLMDEFNLGHNEKEDFDADELDGIVEWFEDIQLEEKINKEV